MQGSRVREENQALVVHPEIASSRHAEFGAGLRPRLERTGGDEIERRNGLEDEPISPELILVSAPEVARRAREQLPVVPSHRPGYDEASVATLQASAVLREIRAVVPAAVPETEVDRRRKMRWWMVAAVIVVAAVVAIFVMGERRRDRAALVSAQPAQKSQPESTGTRTTASPRRRPPRAAAPATPAVPKTVRHKPAAAPAKTTPTPPAKTTTTAPKSPTATPTVEGSGSLPTRTAPKPPARARTTPPPPAAPRTFVPSRVFAWPPDGTASGYLVRFFRDDAKVYERQVTKPRLALPASFRFLAGHYRWEVLPIHGSATGRRYGAPIVESTFVLTAGSGT